MKKDAYELLADALVALHARIEVEDSDMARAIRYSIEDIAPKHRLKITPKETK